MEEIYCIKVSNTRSGFTNQLLAFITGLEHATYYKKNIVVIDNILTDFEKDDYISFSHVVDINHLNKILNDKNFNITVFDKDYFEIKLKNIMYGIDDNIIDIKQEICSKFYPNNVLSIPKDVDFNYIKYDPIVGKVKNLWINYTINDKEFTNIHHETRPYDIVLDFNKNFEFKYTFTGISWWNRENIDYILSNLLYTDRFINIATDFTSKILSKTINVVHLRVEDDAIKHITGLNNISYDDYKNRLCEKYITLISKYFDKNDHIIVLTYDINNPVIKFGESATPIKLKPKCSTINCLMFLLRKRIRIGCSLSNLVQFLHLQS